MAVMHSDKDASQPRSNIACHVCRKRKVKCSRELPCCSLCEQSMQTCEYPTNPLRPGPKIGSTQNPRKRKNQSGDPNKDQPRKQLRRLSSSGDPDSSASPSRKSPYAISNDVSEASESPGAANIQSLSFIIHPSHESCSPEIRKDDSPRSNQTGSQESHVASSCYALGFSPDLLEHIIDQFFENLSSFQLFRKQDVRSELEQVETANQCKAFLATILLFATKNHDDDGEDTRNTQPHEEQNSSSTSFFLTRALKYVDAAIYECEDAPVSMLLLQTITLITHWLLIQGVRGRAWRYLRVAVGCAYELNMHLIDSNKCLNFEDNIEPDVWVEEEARRRVWWAIWEMDVFASVIRRCPASIDWAQNETFLPAEDEKWFCGKPQKSCMLRLDLIERYKALEATGNQSFKAWFIVINSLMKDAQKITNPVGLDRTPTVRTHEHSPIQANKMLQDHSGRLCPSSSEESLKRLHVIRNALQCTVMALPRSSKFRGQYLHFGTREIDRQATLTQRLQHSSIYSIHAMIQLTSLMIHKYYLFNNDGGQASKNDDHCRRPARTQALEMYSEAADEIVSLIGRSCEEHYKYVNPFLASTIWLAGAVQLLYRELAPLDKSAKDLTNSKLELLSRTYNRFMSYWNMSPTLQKNLQVVESEIYNLHSEADMITHHDHLSNPRLMRGIQRPITNKSDSLMNGLGVAEAFANEVRQMAARESSNYSTIDLVNRFQRGNMLANADVLKTANGLAAVTSGQIQKDAAQVQRSSWFLPAGDSVNVNQYPDDMANNVNQLDCQLFSTNRSIPTTQPPISSKGGVGSNVGTGAFFDTTTTPTSTTTAMQQMPGLSQGMPSGDSLVTNTDASSASLFDSSLQQRHSPPDLFSLDLVGANASLSNYFGEIFSGACMARS